MRDQALYPCDKKTLEGGRVTSYPSYGITIRSHIAIEAMKALLIRSDNIIYSEKEIAAKACLVADAMLEVL